MVNFRVVVWASLVFSLAMAPASATPLPITFAESGTVRVRVTLKESALSFDDVTAMLYAPAPPYTPFWEGLMWAEGQPGNPPYDFAYHAGDIIGFKARLDPGGRWVYTDPELSAYCKSWRIDAYTWGVDVNSGANPSPLDRDLVLEVQLTPAPDPATIWLLAAGVFLCRCRRREKA